MELSLRLALVSRMMLVAPRPPGSKVLGTGPPCFVVDDDDDDDPSTDEPTWAGLWFPLWSAAAGLRDTCVSYEGCSGMKPAGC